ncbi:hypothetical protein GJ496_008877 [Pomphorhynchus laevis]|nr:hypothetical protein GJ496_008877 [Pomphorhynchus laevis]
MVLTYKLFRDFRHIDHSALFEVIGMWSEDLSLFFIRNPILRFLSGFERLVRNLLIAIASIAADPVELQVLANFLLILSLFNFEWVITDNKILTPLYTLAKVSFNETNTAWTINVFTHWRMTQNSHLFVSSMTVLLAFIFGWLTMLGSMLSLHYIHSNAVKICIWQMVLSLISGIFLFTSWITLLVYFSVNISSLGSFTLGYGFFLFVLSGLTFIVGSIFYLISAWKLRDARLSFAFLHI